MIDQKCYKTTDTFRCTIIVLLDCLQVISQKCNLDGIEKSHVIYVWHFWLRKEDIRN